MNFNTNTTELIAKYEAKKEQLEAQIEIIKEIINDLERLADE